MRIITNTYYRQIMYWSECRQFSQAISLYELVTPPDDRIDEQGLIERFRNSHNYRCYLLKRNEIDNPYGLAIMAYLSKSKVLHVDTFMLAPKIRQQGLAKLAWTSLLNKLPSEWTTTRIQMEAYLHNVEPWRNIIGVSVTKTHLPDPMYLTSPIKVMIKGIAEGHDVTQSYTEWQDFQKLWNFQRLAKL